MGSLSRGDFERWLEAYRRAWEDADADAVVELFTEDAIYRSSPFHEPHVGSDAIHAYWSRAVGGQTERRVLIGRPIVEDDRAAAEWWTTFVDSQGEPATLPGILFLRFGPGRRCVELREAWSREPGIRPPHDGWGS